jgi:hypothetical protein
MRQLARCKLIFAGVRINENAVSKHNLKVIFQIKESLAANGR